VIFERIKSAGIASNSYLIGSGSEAAVIDPRRDCQIYIDSAQQKGLKIKHIFETHRNEDYVSGSIELANITGAEIYHGTGLDWKFGNTVQDGQEFQVGRLRLTAIHTPGHTDERVSYALADLATGKATVMVFTGDALFVNDVGRTDLYGTEEEPRLAEVSKDRPVAVICNVGHLAGLGASILLRAGYPCAYNVLGSVKAWVAAGFPVTTDQGSQ
jgi:hydroxyacylglutathione hydrolase